MDRLKGVKYEGLCEWLAVLRGAPSMLDLLSSVLCIGKGVIQ